MVRTSAPSVPGHRASPPRCDALPGRDSLDEVVQLRGTVTGLTRVLLSVNGQLPLTATGTTNWSSTFGLEQGVNTVRVTAEDVAGNVSAPVTIQVTYVLVNPPNDLFENALPLSGNAGTVSAITTNATKEIATRGTGTRFRIRGSQTRRANVSVATAKSSQRAVARACQSAPSLSTK